MLSPQQFPGHPNTYTAGATNTQSATAGASCAQPPCPCHDTSAAPAPSR